MNQQQTVIGEKYLGKLDLDSSDFNQRIGKGKVCTHISLFSGCGGLDCGFAKAGIQTRVMVEFDKFACQTLRANFHWEELKTRTNEDGSLKWKSKEELIRKSRAHQEKKANLKEEDFGEFIDAGVESWYHYPEPVIFERDIKEVKTEEILEAAKLKVGECSVVSGGFPCQGFSTAGKRVRDDPRNALYKEFVRIVDEVKPASIFGENVPGIVSMGKGEVIKQICEDFANCGYDICWDILNAADYGVPQTRKRVILIGKRVDSLEFNGENRPVFRIAASPGTITHPYLFYEGLKRWKQKELLEEMQRDSRVNFAEKKERNTPNTLNGGVSKKKMEEENKREGCGKEFKSPLPQEKWNKCGDILDGELLLCLKCQKEVRNSSQP